MLFISEHSTGLEGLGIIPCKMLEMDKFRNNLLGEVLRVSFAIDWASNQTTKDSTDA